MPEARSVETVRREIEVERTQLAQALERLRDETAVARRRAGRRARSAALVVVAAGAVAAAVRILVRRISR